MTAFRVLGVVLSLVMLTLALAVGEVTFRRIDGFTVFSTRLGPIAVAPASKRSSQTADARYVAGVPRAPGVDRGWYERNPPSHPKIAVTAAIAKRYERYKNTADPAVAFYLWNRLGLQEYMCNNETRRLYDGYDDFLVFDSPSGSQWPMFRHPPHAQPPGWFPTNNWGWRGPDVMLNKPSGTIRIAFLGSSKTIDPFGVPFSHIEYIGEWLMLWMRAQHSQYRVDVINASRSGIDEVQIAAILRDEVLQFEPDLLIDDGGNNFGPQLLLPLQARTLPKPERAAGEVATWSLDRYSALSRRIHSAIVRLEHLDGSEPRKPIAAIQWPRDVDELHPDVARKPLPMQLDDLLAFYDQMRAELESQGGQFALPSWIVMARDGLKLDLSRDLGLFNNLNWTYYPVTYAQLRRAADFYNRVFKAYAERNGLLFIDVASAFPMDPDLFRDSVHLTEQGARLEAWIYFQAIARWLDAQIARGVLPRAQQRPRDQHPGFQQTDYPLMTRAELLAACRTRRNPE